MSTEKEKFRPRINSLSKRMDILDRFVKINKNSLTCGKWAQYFKLSNICSNEYAKLIRL